MNRGVTCVRRERRGLGPMHPVQLPSHAVLITRVELEELWRVGGMHTRTRPRLAAGGIQQHRCFLLSFFFAGRFRWQQKTILAFKRRTFRDSPPAYLF